MGILSFDKCLCRPISVWSPFYTYCNMEIFWRPKHLKGDNNPVDIGICSDNLISMTDKSIM